MRVSWDEAAAFWTKVLIKGQDECWEWQGTKNGNGYGIFSSARCSINAHRMAYRLFYGPIPFGKEVRHDCDNRPCCNPKHLLLGTHIENMQDMHERGRRKTAKLTFDQVTAIRQDKRYHRVIATEYGITKSNVSAIKCGRSWREKDR